MKIIPPSGYSWALAGFLPWHYTADSNLSAIVSLARGYL